MSNNIRLITVILLIIFILFTVLIVRFYTDVDIADKKSDSQNSGSFGKEMYSFYDERSLYGIRDEYNRVIIEAAWHSIRQIDAERFIVSRQENEKIRYGIIDIHENITVPVIYSNISNVSEKYLIGRIDYENGKSGYVLFDLKGEVLVREEWNSYLKKYEDKPLNFSGNYIQLRKDKDICRLRYGDNGCMRVFYLRFERNILDCETEITINNFGNVLDVSNTYQIYSDIVNKSVQYTSALFEDDSASLKYIVFEDEYKNIQSISSDFRGCELSYAGKVTPQVIKEEGRLKYTCQLTVVYSTPLWDGIYTSEEAAAFIDISFKKNQEGELLIYDVQVTPADIEKLDIPRNTETEMTEEIYQDNNVN